MYCVRKPEHNTFIKGTAGNEKLTPNKVYCINILRENKHIDNYINFMLTDFINSCSPQTKLVMSHHTRSFLTIESPSFIKLIREYTLRIACKSIFSLHCLTPTWNKPCKPTKTRSFHQ